MNRFTRILTIVLVAVVGLGVNATVIAEDSDTIDITITEAVAEPDGVVSVTVEAGTFETIAFSGAAQTSEGTLIFTSTDARTDMTGPWSATASVTNFGATNPPASFVADIDLESISLSVDPGLPSAAIVVQDASGITSGSPPVTDVVVGSTGTSVPQNVRATYGATVNIPPAQEPGSYSATVTVTVAGGGNP